MERRRFIGSITGVMLAGLFKWNFPMLGKPIEELLVLDQGKPTSRTVWWAGGTGEWDNPLIWTSGQVPGAGDVVFINSGHILPSKNKDAVLEAESLNIRNGTVEIGTIELSDDWRALRNTRVVDAADLDAIEKRGVEMAKELTWDSES